MRRKVWNKKNKTKLFFFYCDTKRRLWLFEVSAIFFVHNKNTQKIFEMHKLKLSLGQEQATLETSRYFIACKNSAQIECHQIPFNLMHKSN